MTLGPDVEATFIAGDPPRDGWLALWGTGGRSLVIHPEFRALARESIVVVLPAGRLCRRKTVVAARLELTEAIDLLVELPATADVTASVRAWATAARLALELVARGRLLPGATDAGFDSWRLGPFDPADIARQRQLAAALPPAAHAVYAADSRPLGIADPETLVRAFGDAVADTYARTAAATIEAEHEAFAARQPITVGAGAGWLATASGGHEDGAAVALRLVPPAEDEDHADDETDAVGDIDADDFGRDDGDGAGEPFRAVAQLQSRVDPSLVIDAADLWTAPDAVLRRFGDDTETALLLALRRGSRVWPPLERLLDQARPGELHLADHEADELLGPISDDLAAAGLQVLWPADLVQQVDLRPVVGTPAPAAVTGSGLSLNTLCELRWRASVDGHELTDEELEALADAKRPMVRLRGRWVRADPARLARLRERRQVEAGAALAGALGGVVPLEGDDAGAAMEVEVVGPLADLAARLKALDARQHRGAPDGVAAELRPYQEQGLAWLGEMADLGTGGILADDMGLGKTLQLLSLHVDRIERLGDDRPALVICPSSVIANWEREANRFAPSVPVRRFHGSARHVDGLERGELVLATYGVVRRDVALLESVEWALVVADEAQVIKNPFSRTARALRRLRPQARFALTGTPVENRLTDLWALLDWTTPGLLGTLDRFRREVAVPVERERDPVASDSLSRLIRPFVLRRRKADPAIAPDLPPKTETDQFVPLTNEQATLYRAVLAETLASIEASEGMARRGLVLKLTTALKQICNHPAHYLGQPGPLTGRSGKLEAATELVEVIADEGDAVLVFTQYVAMGHLLERHLNDRGIGTLFLHGSTRVTKRQDLVDQFQAGAAPVFIVSLKAGGTGLNLTRATHVIHYDRWWNPAVEDQASDRAWRIGQDRPVQVHRLMCEGTLEEKVATLLASKRELADAVVGSGEGWISELSNEELADLVALGQAGQAGPGGEGASARAAGYESRGGDR